jgi:hypothetical protein
MGQASKPGNFEEDAQQILAVKKYQNTYFDIDGIVSNNRIRWEPPSRGS